MKRNEWTFEMPATQLAEAAKAKVQHHAQRLQFWKGAQEGVMADVREKGLSVEQSLAGSAYSSKTQGYGPEIVVDVTYQRRLNEANGKITEHTKKLAEYEGWVQVLSANKDRTYPLHADDYLFFFGR